MSPHPFCRVARGSRRALIAFALAAPLAVPAQARAPKPLPAPNAEFEEPLTGPLRFVELRDGRLLVHDQGEKKLATLDFTSGEMTDVSREGNGPTEFRSALALLRAPNDSVWLYDLIAQRVLIIGPDGKPVRTQLFANSGDPMAMMNRPFVREHDALGRTYGEVRAFSFSEGRMSFGDSVTLVRTSGNRLDTLTRLPNHIRAPSFDGTTIKLHVPGFVAWDAWGVFPDGRVMIVRGEDYVPELFLPNGTHRTATALPFTPVAVTSTDREEMIAETRRAMEQGMNFARSMAAGQAMPAVVLEEPKPWQSVKPPIAGQVILVDSRLRAWVPVTRRPGDVGERFDLLDADARLLDTVLLPKDVTLLGFGNGVLYTARKDADDLLWVRRHPLP